MIYHCCSAYKGTHMSELMDVYEETCGRRPSTVSARWTQTALCFSCAHVLEAWASTSQPLTLASSLTQTGIHRMTCRCGYLCGVLHTHIRTHIHIYVLYSKCTCMHFVTAVSHPAQNVSKIVKCHSLNSFRLICEGSYLIDSLSSPHGLLSLTP